MKILVLGAGAVGGYFGGRLLEKGEDVTFLVRESRQKQLNESGLVIKSVHGDVCLQPKTILTGQLDVQYDIILLTTKAYHLNEAIEAIKPHLNKNSVILPLLNGYQHYNILKEAFGAENVLGGLCFIESTLNERGEVIQTSPTHRLLFGELLGGTSPRVKSINELFSDTKAEFNLSENIEQDIWHKYLFITTLSGITTLMRSSIGPIREVRGGMASINQLFEEVALIMRTIGAPIQDDIVPKQLAIINNQASSMKASMLRDMEKSFPIEADHLQGFLLDIAEKHDLKVPLLKLVYQNLMVYELQ